MSHNKYPGQNPSDEGDPTQTPEAAFNSAFDNLMARPATEQPHAGSGTHAPGELTVKDRNVPDMGTIRTIQAHTSDLGHRVDLSLQDIDGVRQIHADAVTEGGVSLVTATYSLMEAPTGEKTVTTLATRDAMHINPADAAFLAEMGFGEAMMSASQPSASDPNIHHGRYFAQAAEVSRLAGLPELAAAYQG